MVLNYGNVIYFLKIAMNYELIGPVKELGHGSVLSST